LAKFSMWVASSTGVEEWVDAVEPSAAAPRKLSLAEQIAATRAKVKEEAQAAASVEPLPRKLTLAEQIAATRAAAKGGAEQSTDDQAKEARAARAAAKAAAEAAEALAEVRAEEEQERAARAAAKKAAEDEALRAMVEAEAGARKLTLAEQIAATRVASRREAAAKQAAKEAAAAESPAAESAKGVGPPGFEWCSGDADTAVPDNIRAAIDAGRVDELHMLLANVPTALRSSPKYKTLRKDLMAEAKDRATLLRP